jgi:hypothetical protein
MIRTLLAVAVALGSVFAHAAVPERPPQFVLLAFDGSKDISFWEESRAFAEANNLDFTYFVSGVYFILDKDHVPTKTYPYYTEPHSGVSKSNIGWGGTDLSVMKQRLQEVKLAMAEGNEMASHANAHFDGSNYSQAQWELEFKQFTQIMSNVWDRYDAGNEPQGWKEYFANDVVGFRAPLLGIGATGEAEGNALEKFNFTYDTSRVGKTTYWPTRAYGGFWNFPLAGLPVVGEDGKIKKKKNGADLTTLSMDYNFYYTHSNGVKGDPSQFKRYENEMYNSYMAYFNKNYVGNRGPVHIGHHFSKWNGGAYWKAMQRFAKNVCKMKEVKCVTYKELVNFVNQNEANIADYQKGNFSRDGMPSLPNGATPASLANTELSDAALDEVRAMPQDPAEAHEE